MELEDILSRVEEMDINDVRVKHDERRRVAAEAALANLARKTGMSEDDLIEEIYTALKTDPRGEDDE